MANKTVSENLAIAFFKQFGFQVEEVPVAEEKRADLFAYDSKSGYLIEVKEKDDTGQHSIFSEVELPSGKKVTYRSDAHQRLWRFENILKHGRDQLIATPNHEQYFKIIFFHFDGPNSDVLDRRLAYTFYGVANLISRYDEGESVNCVYFDYSAAYSLPEINGLMISDAGDLRLAINEFSPNANEFRKSSLVKKFGNAVYDPMLFEADKSTIVLRSDIPRKDENLVLEAVRQQTGIEYLRVVLDRYTFG